MLCSSAFGNHEGDDVVVLIGERKVSDDAALGDVGGEFATKLEIGFAQSVVHDGDGRQLYRRAHTDAQSLAQRFLGGKAFSQEARRIVAGAAGIALGRRKNFFQRALAVAFVKLGHARHDNDIGTNSENHTGYALRMQR